MKLSGRNGASVSIAPVSYEFVDTTSEDPFDKNWLVIEVNAMTADGSWSARDACLTTWDASGVGQWLSSVAADGIAASLPDAEGEITPSLAFLEPALAFSLAPSDDGLRHLRVHLTYGLAPPWLDIDEKLVPWQHFVVVVMADAEILLAAQCWRSKLAEFPER